MSKKFVEIHCGDFSPKKNLLGINPLTGILSTWYRLRSMDGTDSIPFEFYANFENQVHASVAAALRAPQPSGKVTFDRSPVAALLGILRGDHIPCNVQI